MKTLLVLVLLMFSAYLSTAYATHKPRWEAGLLGGGFSIPKYSGSDERYSIPLVFPYFIFRGDHFKVDRRGVRGTINLSDRSTIDLGFSYNLPVDNDKNEARKGMDNLPLIAQVGPRFNFRITEKKSPFQLMVRLPIRSAWGFNKGFVGLVLRPNILLSYSSKNNLFRSFLGLGLSYRSIEHNALFYDVAPQYKNSSRKAYKSGEGLHSIDTTLFSMRYFTKTFGAGAFVKWQDMSVGVVDDSPLVRKTGNYSGGFIFIWTFWESKERSGGKNHLNHADEDAI